MGLALRDPSSFNLTGAPGGPGSVSDTDLDPTNFEPSCRSPNPRTSRTAKQARRSRKSAFRGAVHQASNRACPPALEIHHVKPRWAADVDEGAALARSAIALPGETYHGSERDDDSQTSPRSRSTSSSRRRPPSLERQDAFRDVRTVKRRRGSSSSGEEVLGRSSSVERDGMERELEEAQEIEQLYWMGLLYDDEHERGEGFSMDRIVREEPVYSVRVRPARNRRYRRVKQNVSMDLGLDLAFPALAEDKALAQFLLSPHKEGEVVAPGWRATTHDTPPLTVIYELADEAVAPAAADDLLDSVSEISGWTEEDELAWAIIDGCNGNGSAAARAATDEEMEDGDPWVVLGHDGS